MKRTALITFALLVAAVAVAGQAGPWKRTVTKDAKATHKLVVKTDFQGTPIEFHAKLLETVKEVKEDGSYILNEEMAEVTLVMDGQEQDAGGGTGASTRLVDANGETKKIDSEQGDADEYRFANLTTFIFPKEAPAKGLKWAHKIATDTARNLVDTDFAFEILDKETVGTADCWKVSFSVKEATGEYAAKSSGTMWVGSKDGLVQKVESKFENMPVQGMALNGSLTITRQ